MRLLSLLRPGIIFVACAPGLMPLPISTPYSISMPCPAPKPTGADILEALQVRVKRDESVPLIDLESVIALIGGQRVYASITQSAFVLHL